MQCWKFVKQLPAPQAMFYLQSNDGDHPSFSASVKWDGCVNLSRYFNAATPDNNDTDNVDNLHICDIDDMIERLQEIKKIAKDYKENNPAFSESW